MDEERREEDRKREMYLFCSVRRWVHALQHFSHQQRVYKTAILLKRRKKTTRRHTHTDIVIHIQTRKKEEGRERVESKKKRFFFFLLLLHLLRLRNRHCHRRYDFFFYLVN